jgi:hypothetical protein
MVRRPFGQQAAGAAERASHILSKIPHEDLPHPKVKLPARQKSGDYKNADYPFRVIPEIF